METNHLFLVKDENDTTHDSKYIVATDFSDAFEKWLMYVSEKYSEVSDDIRHNKTWFPSSIELVSKDFDVVL